MYARSAPGHIFSHHTEDEIAQFLAHASSPSRRSMPGKPFPVEPETSTMPANDCLRLDNDQHILPIWPEVPYCHPKESVRCSKPRSRVTTLQDTKLLPEGNDFQEQSTAGPKSRGSRTQQPNHSSSSTRKQAMQIPWLIYLT
jgi:hypothetical protein